MLTLEQGRACCAPSQYAALLFSRRLVRIERVAHPQFLGGALEPRHDAAGTRRHARVRRVVDDEARLPVALPHGAQFDAVRVPPLQLHRPLLLGRGVLQPVVHLQALVLQVTNVVQWVSANIAALTNRRSASVHSPFRFSATCERSTTHESYSEALMSLMTRGQTHSHQMTITRRAHLIGSVKIRGSVQR